MMLNSEIKSILEQQFSMERNYDKIIKKAEKKKRTGYMIFRLSLIPICIVILAVLLIPKNNIVENKVEQYRQTLEIAVKENREDDDILDRKHNLDTMSKIDTEQYTNNQEIFIIKVKIIEENKKAEIVEYVESNNVDFENKKIYINNLKLEEGKEYTLYINKETYEIKKVVE